MLGGGNEQPLWAAKGLPRVRWDLVWWDFLMGGGARAALVRPDAPCYLTKETPGSLLCKRFWPWAIAGRGEHPRRTGRNEQGLRDPPGDYGSSRSMNIAIAIQKYINWPLP